ncbi:hypothetical protein K493DRAFT_317117 [Basidiobolus meristosporus CBS 931.73]|uniref:SERTA domain-containing protein n=1 Tax=Basidiobolus meristosporus CBS 931.73 TaxID=1314790 RepID=A0A1Y1Y243_9FUNG|nr:hypothetical protein K493DRAFT_317117 [Basidiobolus meristosporus CBS 931.73]|eukprot:ORX91694.1 hypothetical protein K493DRAFT_317117 [Basidiobolus meristosporus CBS 931.73]
MLSVTSISTQQSPHLHKQQPRAAGPSAFSPNALLDHVSFSAVMPNYDSHYRLMADPFRRVGLNCSYEDWYYQLHDISQKKLLSLSESHRDQGVRKAVLINNLFRTLPTSLEDLDLHETTDLSYEPVPNIELEEQSWFDSCLDDLSDDDEDDEVVEADDDLDQPVEMEWSMSSGSTLDDSFMECEENLIPIPAHFPEISGAESHPEYLLLGSPPPPSTNPSKGEGRLRSFLFQDKSIPSAHPWSEHPPNHLLEYYNHPVVFL